MDWSGCIGKRVRAAVEIRWDGEDRKEKVARDTLGMITDATDTYIEIEWDNGKEALLPTGDDAKLLVALHVEGDGDALNAVRIWNSAMADYMTRID